MAANNKPKVWIYVDPSKVTPLIRPEDVEYIPENLLEIFGMGKKTYSEHGSVLMKSYEGRC
jgi:hypothetical protein